MVTDCPYGDEDSVHCTELFNSSRGLGHCYDSTNRASCCQSCADIKNATNVGMCTRNTDFKCVNMSKLCLKGSMCVELAY